MNLLLATLAKAIAKDGPALLYCVAHAIAETMDDSAEETAADVLFTLAKWGERNRDRFEEALRVALGVDR